MLQHLRSRTPDRTALSFPRSALRLHAMVTTAGCDHVHDHTYDHDGSGRGPYVLLQHTLSGCGRLRLGHRRYAVREGETMLLRFPDDVRYWCEDGKSWEFFWLCLNGREVLRLWREAMAAGPVVRLSGDAVLRLGSLCLDALRGGLSSPARASLVAYETAMILMDEGRVGHDRAPEEAGRSSSSVDRALSLCHADALRDPLLDVARLANVSGLSRHHFTRVFADAVGEPPGRFMRQRRMEEGARLLTTTSLAVKAVALRCGFEDPNSFARAFRRRFGDAPGRYRATEAARQGARAPAASIAAA